MIIVKCPKCHTEMETTESMRGKFEVCPACGFKYVEVKKNGWWQRFWDFLQPEVSEAIQPQAPQPIQKQEIKKDWIYNGEEWKDVLGMLGVLAFLGFWLVVVSLGIVVGPWILFIVAFVAGLVAILIVSKRVSK
jgi:acetyl-CoA carboxylase beta subunit